QRGTPPRLLAANSAVFLDLMGRVVIAWIWTWQANVAAAALQTDRLTVDDVAFYKGKLQAARYFARWELPRTVQQAELLMKLDDTCLAMEDAWF
ncbi:MAG: acyl-CoA dehydrogenase C-terminal domain-containing protein, partial [Pseudomonadota bacterium]